MGVPEDWFVTPPAGQEGNEEWLLYVKSGPEADQACALFERHWAHPDWEVFIGPGVVGQVARTDMVRDRLRDGRLVIATQEEYDGYQARLTAPRPALTPSGLLSNILESSTDWNRAQGEAARRAARESG